MKIVNLRKFTAQDIPLKIQWINNPENNRYLHYDLPLEYDKTFEWFQRTKDDSSRLDLVIEYDQKPVGVIGLLKIDKATNSGEYYVCLGERAVKGKGVAKIASQLLFFYAKDSLGLKTIYLYTDKDNVAAQKVFEAVGFAKIKSFNNVTIGNKTTDRLYYECKL